MKERSFDMEDADKYIPSGMQYYCYICGEGSHNPLTLLSAHLTNARVTIGQKLSEVCIWLPDIRHSNTVCRSCLVLVESIAEHQLVLRKIIREVNSKLKRTCQLFRGGHSPTPVADNASANHHEEECDDPLEQLSPAVQASAAPSGTVLDVPDSNPCHSVSEVVLPRESRVVVSPSAIRAVSQGESPEEEPRDGCKNVDATATREGTNEGLPNNESREIGRTCSRSVSMQVCVDEDNSAYSDGGETSAPADLPSSTASSAPAGDTLPEAAEGGGVRCSDCPGRAFASAASLHRHRRKKHERQMCCPFCARAVRENYIQMHILIKHSRTERGFLCTLCERYYETAKYLKIHLKTVHGDGKQYQCTECGRLLANRGSLYTHMQRHRRRLQCGECGQRFALRTQLETHRRRHTGEKPFLCCDCGRAFSSADQLRKHAVSHAPAPPACDQCGRQFASRAAREAHRRTHSGERPHTCDTCGKTFKRASHLDAHRAGVHSQTRPYRCDQCDRAFTLESYLKKHKLLHSGERPHGCDLCGKRFSKKFNLQAHMKTHDAATTPARRPSVSTVPKSSVTASCLTSAADARASSVRAVPIVPGGPTSSVHANPVPSGVVCSVPSVAVSAVPPVPASFVSGVPLVTAAPLGVARYPPPPPVHAAPPPGALVAVVSALPTPPPASHIAYVWS